MKKFWKNIWDKKGNSNSTDLLYLCGWEHLDIEIDSKLIANKIINQMDIQDTDSILEIGCGAGFLSREFQSYSYRGIDYSETLINKHKQLFPEHDVLVASANSLPFADDMFDIVICPGVFQYLPNTKYALEVINEMTRVSRKSIMVIDIKTVATNDKHFVFPKHIFEEQGFSFSKCTYCDDDTRYNAYKEIKNDLE